MLRPISSDGPADSSIPGNHVHDEPSHFATFGWRPPSRSHDAKMFPESGSVVTDGMSAHDARFAEQRSLNGGDPTDAQFPTHAPVGVNLAM